MNAITVIEASPPAVARDEWIDRGRGLVARRREVDWEIAEWMHEGKKAGHLTQAKFDFLSDSLGLAPRRLKDALKAAESFPPHLRDRTLSVEHHAALASLPKDEALPLLSRAAKDHLQVQDLREAVTQYRYQTGERFDDDDTSSTLCTLMLRAWNRANPEARELAFEHIKIAAAKGFAIIDEDEASNDEE